MKKINIILDETTILNFPFIWKLVKRYYKTAAILSVIPFVIGGIYHFKQLMIFSTSISFKSLTNETESPTSAIASLLGEKTNTLAPEELIAIGHGSDFLFKLANRVYQDENFSKLVLGPLNAETYHSTEEILRPCKGNEDCIKRLLGGTLAGFYSMVQDRFVDNKINITVRTLDPYTSSVLLRHISEQMTDERILMIKHFLSSQKNISEDLIEKKKQELKDVNIEKLVENKSILSKELFEVERRFEQLSRVYEDKKFQLSKAEITLNQTNKAISRSMDTAERSRLEKIETLKNRISEIENDISALELNREKFSKQDKSIIDQLKKELSSKITQLHKLGGAARTLSSQDEFISSKDKSSNFTEFEYGILKKEFEKIEKEYLKLQEKKREVAKNMQAVETKFEEYKPSFEYLKLLEGKLVQIRLIESTVVSDIVFDNNASPVVGLKRSTKMKVFIVCTGFGIFLAFVYLIARYLLDSKIYDEDELKSNFNDLEIIGNTPDFN